MESTAIHAYQDDFFHEFGLCGRHSVWIDSTHSVLTTSWKDSMAKICSPSEKEFTKDAAP